MGGKGRGKHKRAGKLKARQSALKDSYNDHADQNDEILEELTALAAIFQDDFKLISEKPRVEFSINLRPHSVDDEADKDYLSAELFVRYLPGYPQRPPRLQITSKKGLTDEQLQSLHSMLLEQAASIAREGRVMIFNLTEAAQEFLSDQNRDNYQTVQPIQLGEGSSPLSKSLDEGWHGGMASGFDAVGDELGLEDSIYLDLFNNLWGEGEVQLQESRINGSCIENGLNQMNGVAFKERRLAEETKRREPWVEGFQEVRSNTLAGADLDKVTSAFGVDKGALQVDQQKSVKDEGACENIENQPSNHLINSHSTSVFELLRRVRSGLICRIQDGKNFKGSEDRSPVSDTETANEDDSTQSGFCSFPDSPSAEDVAAQSIRKDLVLGYLLRLVCSHRGPLPQALPVLASELQDIGILSQWANDLVVNQPQLLDATFRQMFAQLPKGRETKGVGKEQAYPALSRFWSASPELLGEGGDTSSSSRYLSDFEEISLLGRGGFGHVVLCKNKLDGRRYAMKKIRLKDRSTVLNDKILREVATLSRLQHHHVVRYYQAWIETDVGHLHKMVKGTPDDSEGSEEWFFQGGTVVGSSTGSAAIDEGASAEAIFLYIQMEYCSRTLREVFDSSAMSGNKDEIWRIFRQIVEGLAHIHGQGIIHRDLNPNNIFFDARGDIKIGDFGLAKFTNLEQPDRDPNPNAPIEVTSTSLDGTGQVGTYFYTAPEVDQGLPHVDVKVDMYSLGVVFFELWYPFGTAMERYVILNDLKHNGVLPSTWASEFVQQEALVRWLLAPNASDRPTAAQVLRSELLPPRMENESLNDILRTIQNAQDTSVYDQVVAAIFDDERMAAKTALVEADFAKLKRRNKARTLRHVVGQQDNYLDNVKEVFMRHGAQHVESFSFDVVDDSHFSSRQVLKLLDSSGNLLEARYEMRLSLARWVAVNQISSLKSYEISRVYRRGVGDSAPREYFQGDFDLIGGARTLVDAEAVKVAVEVVSKFPVWDGCEVRVNHRQILSAIWTWTGVQYEDKQKVAQVLAMMGSASPQSTTRKALWPHVRRQLLQGLRIPEAVVDRLQTVERRLSGSAYEVLPRLRGALPPSATSAVAIEELSTMLRYLRIWNIEKEVTIDGLMAATENYFNGIFFQVHVHKTNHSIRNMQPASCVATGGRYDRLIAKFWSNSVTNPAPGAVGLSIALQQLLDTTTTERYGAAADVLVCSKGGGGLLTERMEIVNDLWSANIKAEYLCLEAPSLTEQYEYAHDRGIKWLVIITEAALSLAGTVKVRHLELRVEEDVPKLELVKYFTDIGSTSAHLRKKAFSTRSGN